MKVVACKNCGAKYQIDDNETIEGYECSVCAGSLEEVENYPLVSSNLNKKSRVEDLNSQKTDSGIVYCKNCGLKYRLDSNENIDDYECASCYGELRYADEKINRIIEERKLIQKNLSDNSHPNDSSSNINHDNYNKDIQNKTENKPITLEKRENTVNTSEDKKTPEEKKTKNNENKQKDNKNQKTKQKISRKQKMQQKANKKVNKENTAENISSEESQSPNHEKNSEEESNKNQQNNDKDYNLNDVELENNEKAEIPKEKDLNEETLEEKSLEERNLKEKDLEEKTLEEEDLKEKNLKEKDSKEKNETKSHKKDLMPDPNITNKSYHDVYIIAGLIVALIGFADVLFSERIYSLGIIGIGFILFGIGVFKIKNHKATEKRGKIIRERLLTLPEKFYVLYYVKVPDSSSGINHVVVGPSGIFSIIGQNYSEKEDKERLRTDIENERMIANSKLDDLILAGTDSDDDANHVKGNKKFQFKYTRKKIEFDHNNKIKQKAIHLSEDLVTFLGENGFDNCYTEPLVGFVNNEVAVINMPLTDEDLFLDELLYKIVHGPKRLDDITTHRVAVLLSQYSTECSS
ncbi:MAG: hypothetical protein FWE58_03055 [Methanobrevibacter sp.]|nr:hypothetical protein [Methanobrevibacter sp.]